jgi:hypothetical protein
MATAFQECISRLMTLEDELHYIDPASLSKPLNLKRASAIDAVDACIQDLVTKRLKDLTRQGAQALDELDQSTKSMEVDLERVKNAAETIKLAASALTKIVGLVALL